MLTEKKRTDSELLFHGDGQELYHAAAPITQHTLIFDPPWNIATEFDMSASDNILAFCDGYRAGDIVRMFGPPTWVFAWDCVSSWYTPNRPLRRMKMCFWYGDVTQYKQKGYLFGDPCGKPRIVTNSRGSYLFTPDTGKMLSDVYSHPITSLHSTSGHEHSKPLDWLTALIANTIRDGDIIIDPFAGSGATLQACRKLGVNWLGAELDDARAYNIARLPHTRTPPKSAQATLFDED